MNPADNGIYGLFGNQRPLSVGVCFPRAVSPSSLLGSGAEPEACPPSAPGGSQIVGPASPNAVSHRAAFLGVSSLLSSSEALPPFASAASSALLELVRSLKENLLKTSSD